MSSYSARTRQNMCMSSQTADIERFCMFKKMSQPSYIKLTTGGNDPTISRSMRYSQLVRSQRHTIVVNASGLGGLGGGNVA